MHSAAGGKRRQRICEETRMIYLDHAGTTPVPRPVADAMYEVLTDQFGNPSSQYPLGREAKQLVEGCRATVAGALGCRPENLHFTSCGTESDNWAISAAVWQGRHAGRHIITTAVEHSAVLEPCRWLQQQGYEVTYLAPDKTGQVTVQQVADALREDTVLVSMMLVNNETGCVFPVEETARLLREKKSRALLHCDAVQGFLKVPCDPVGWGVDLMSLSAHKIGGPKGVGALYVRRGFPLVSIIEGGAQERGKRAGTENIPGICGMAAALKEACDHMDENMPRVAAMRDRLIEGLSKIPHSALNGDRVNRLPGNVSFCFEGIEGESLLLLLDMKGVCASSGSACTSGSLDPSHVLLAIGRPHEVAHGSLRLSLCHDTTEAQVDYILEKVPGIVAYLRDMSPMWKDLESGKRTFIL